MAHSPVKRIGNCVRSPNYVVSVHATEELDDDNLSISKTSFSPAKSSSGSATAKRTSASSSSAASRLPDSTPKQLSGSARVGTSSSLRSTLSSSLCASCGHPGAQLRKVTRSFGRGSSLLVIENIPVWSCPHCGESYFTAQTLHEIERTKTLRKSVAVHRSIPVAVFQESHTQLGGQSDAARYSRALPVTLTLNQPAKSSTNCRGARTGIRGGGFAANARSPVTSTARFSL